MSSASAVVVDRPDVPPPAAADEPDRRARRGLRRLSRTQQRIVVWGLLLVAWQIFGMLAGSFFFASVTDTVAGLVRFIHHGHFPAFLESFRQLLIGFGLSVAVGIPCGVIVGGFRAGDATIGVYVRALFVTSMEALLPFLILLFGSALQFRIVVVFLFAVLYVTMNTAAGVREVDPRYLETARAFGASRLRIARDVVLPAATPYVFAGIRLGWGFAVKGMVIAELWITTGLGKVLRDLGDNRVLDQYFAIALLIVAVGALGSGLIQWLQRAVAPWSSIQRGVRSLGGRS
jgi:ABC-type nitrate/sulfonate/bicarbonate transport system permease component